MRVMSVRERGSEGVECVFSGILTDGLLSSGALSPRRRVVLELDPGVRWDYVFCALL